MTFQVDARIVASSFEVFRGPLSNFYLKNDARFVWFILVPRLENIREMYQLQETDQALLLKEATSLSKIMDEMVKPDKINVASLGNIVNQFHLHVIGRFRSDPLWPQGVWQEAAAIDVPVWPTDEANALINVINQALSAIFA